MKRIIWVWQVGLFCLLYQVWELTSAELQKVCRISEQLLKKVWKLKHLISKVVCTLNLFIITFLESGNSESVCDSMSVCGGIRSSFRNGNLPWVLFQSHSHVRPFTLGTSAWLLKDLETVQLLVRENEYDYDPGLLCELMCCDIWSREAVWSNDPYRLWVSGRSQLALFLTDCYTY